MDYMMCLGSAYPTVFASCFGDPTVYTDIVWESGDPLPSQADLDTACFKQSQVNVIDQLELECDDAATVGFSSSALGSPYMYSSQVIDQMNLLGSTVNMSPTAANPSGTSAMYACAPVVNGVVGNVTYISHTYAQIRQVVADGVAFKQSVLMIFATKRYYILNVFTTAAQVNAVTWTSTP